MDKAVLETAKLNDDLHMKVERYTSIDMPESDEVFFEKVGCVDKQ